MTPGGRPFVEHEASLIRELEDDDVARLLVMGALRAGRCPFEALGLPDAPLSPRRAALVLRLSQPRTEDDVMSESDADAMVTKLREKQDREKARNAALHTGYTGPRGQVIPDDLPRLPWQFAYVPPVPVRYTPRRRRRGKQRPQSSVAT